MPARKRLPRVRGEKQVKKTDDPVPVKPVRISRKAKEPPAKVAVDRRKQFSGTDEHAGERKGQPG